MRCAAFRNSAAHFDKKGRGFDVLFDSSQTMDLVGNLAEAMNLGRPEREREAVFAMFVIACRFLATKIMFRIIEAELTADSTHVEGSRQ